jgi:hypothetical protein
MSTHRGPLCYPEQLIPWGSHPERRATHAVASNANARSAGPPTAVSPTVTAAPMTPTMGLRSAQLGGVNRS